MAVTISATLVSSGTPRPVQVVVTGMLDGSPYTVVGSTSGGASWPVPGGQGVSDGGQVVLVDNRAPLNIPVTYVVTTRGATYVSGVVTVTHPGGYVLQSLDGQTVVEFVWRDNGLPRDVVIGSVTFDVQGRARPPARYAPGGDGGGELELRADRENSARLLDLLVGSRPLVVRTDGMLRDFEPVELILPRPTPSSRLWQASGTSTDRVWRVPYLLIDDPEPSAVLAAFTWDDVDDAMTARTWDGFDAMFAASTWDAFDRYDWDQL